MSYFGFSSENGKVVRYRAFLISPTIAGSSPTGVSGARQPETSQIPVTLATLPQSIHLICGHCGTRRRSHAGPDQCSDRGPGGSEKEEASNQPPTGLQHACNMVATAAMLRLCYAVALVLHGVHDLVPTAERRRSGVLRAPPRLVAPARYGAPQQFSLWRRWGRRVRAPNVTKIQGLDRASGLPLDFL